MKRIKLHKTWVVLGAAVAIGILAAFAARSYLSIRIDAIEARGRSKTIKVLVASRELKRGDKLGANAVAVRAVPVDFAHSSAVVPEAFGRVDGQILAYGVRAGEMILWGLLEARRTPTFSARVAVGRRAMTVAVDEINSISGMLEPGDVIDLLITLDRRGRKETHPLLQSVQLMATGQRATNGSQDSERHQYSTVTIDITPEQAKQIILAREAGKVTALLRNPDDKGRLAGANFDIAALLGSGVTQTPAETVIPVLYGGSTRLMLEPTAMRNSTRPPLSELNGGDMAQLTASTARMLTAGNARGTEDAHVPVNSSGTARALRLSD